MDFSNGDIIHVKRPNIEYLQFKRLNELGIVNAYVLKNENLDFRRNSEQEEKSYEILAEELNIERKSIVTPGFAHTNCVRIIDKVETRENLEHIDGLITKEKKIGIIATNADCSILMFYDYKNNIIANVHSGWRGTVQKIAEKTIEKMIKELGSNPKDIICCICPCIRKCHFIVDEDVKNTFENTFNYLGNTEWFINSGEIIGGKQKYHIDTVLINKKMLMNMGIKYTNIIDSNICSVCNNKNITSYRMEGKNFKISAAIMQIQ